MDGAGSKPQRLPLADLGALVVCSLIWGTTWRAIKLQLGVVPPLQSVAYRFALAAALLFVCTALARQSLAMSRRQHLQVFFQGAFGFCLQYGLVYLAEESVSSGAMAVIFASVAFLNLIFFRLFLGRRAPPMAWVAAVLGVLGVAAMSVSEMAAPTGAHDGPRLGLLLALVGVVAAVLNNLFAARAHDAGVALLPGTAWAMGYGAALTTLYLLATGAHWRFEPSVAYVGSLLYLAAFGSVVAFLAYYGLARRRGYTLASYIAALTPPTAMVISTLTEGTRWGLAAALGLALVLGGQVLLIRSSKA